MQKTGFSAETYLQEQSKYILERINGASGREAANGNAPGRAAETGREAAGGASCLADGDTRLYLEFGGKLVSDKHAARVLPGFDENAKIKLLQKMRDQAEVIICVYAGDIATSKTRADFGITYDLEVLRLIDMFREYGLSINSVVITRFEDEPAVHSFINRLERRGIKTYTHRSTKGYPTDVDLIVSEEGYGANPYIEVTKPLVVVNGPGPGSGKLATCLSQLYHEKRLGRKARYAKFETFPVWNLPLKHPVNLAYEAATIDLRDVNMIDSFHLEAYGVPAVNYNRDLEAFPVVRRIIERITGAESEYKSPTDMGVNRVGFAITDDEACREAASQEIIRRYLAALVDYKKGLIEAESLERAKILLDDIGKTTEDRVVVKPARDYAEYKRSLDAKYENVVAMAVELPDGRIVTGRSSRRMVAAGALLLNAVKVLCGFPDELMLITPEVLRTIQRLKGDVLHNEKKSLTANEVLLALTISAATNPAAQMAVDRLVELKGCRAHCTAILSDADSKTCRDLGIDATCDPEYVTNNLYNI